MAFSLQRFERLALRREHEPACRELLGLLAELDEARGHLPPGVDDGAAVPPGMPPYERDRLLCNRIAAAVAALVADPTLQFTLEWQASLLATHRWLGAIFEASDFVDADHVLRVLNAGVPGDAQAVSVSPREITKFCWLYTPQSSLPLDLGALWQHSPALAAGLAVALMSPRLLATPAAHAKREHLLPWLAEMLDSIDDLDELPADVLHDVYMHCSYAQRADKHEVKRGINRLVRRSLQRRGIVDSRPDSLAARRNAAGLPVMLVVLEWFTSQHSIYRTHSRAIEAARGRFQVVGLGLPNCVDAISTAVFDRFVPLPTGGGVYEQLRFIQAQAERLQAQVLYMPSLGMFPLTMMLANLRVATLQAMGLGHPATAHAAAIDAAVVEDDYVGDPACFSEKLLRLPADGMPYRPVAATRAGAQVPTALQRHGRDGVGRVDANLPVQIALCAAAMKINPLLMRACAEVVARSRVPVHFQFLVGQAQGLMVPALRRTVRQALGDAATVWPEQAPEAYRAVLARCEMFVNPFPFGNTNGTVDAIAAGLVGVCKTGREVHEHIDEGMFRRLGLPDWLVTHSVEDYVRATVRLAEQHAERAELSRCFAGPDKVQVFYAGRPELMGDLLGAELQALARA